MKGKGEKLGLEVEDHNAWLALGIHWVERSHQQFYEQSNDMMKAILQKINLVVGNKTDSRGRNKLRCYRIPMR